MAERRMFAKSIVLSDAFLDMPLSARCLYFTLGMLADDDGFVGNPKSIIRQCGASEDDLKVLISKKFVLWFETGVIVIKHWRMNNYLRNDRHHTTTYVEEMGILGIDSKGAYTTNTTKMIDGIPHDNQVTTNGIPTVYQVETEVSIGKDSIDKNINTIVEKNSTAHKEIIDYLNEKTGKHYRVNSKSTMKHINGRLRDGYTVDDFKRIIDTKTKQWLKNDRMSSYLRPETLFCQEHFESYLNECDPPTNNFDDVRKRMEEETNKTIADMGDDIYDGFM